MDFRALVILVLVGFLLGESSGRTWRGRSAQGSQNSRAPTRNTGTNINTGRNNRVHQSNTGRNTRVQNSNAGRNTGVDPMMSYYQYKMMEEQMERAEDQLEYERDMARYNAMRAGGGAMHPFMFDD